MQLNLSQDHGVGLTLSGKRELLRLLEQNPADGARLAGLSRSPGATGKILWDGSGDTGVLLVFDLPPLPSRKVYQLWMIRGKTSIGAGTFTLSPQGTGVLQVKAPEAQRPVEMFAITVEPSGGSPQPTGQMVLKGAPTRPRR